MIKLGHMKASDLFFFLMTLLQMLCMYVSVLQDVLKKQLSHLPRLPAVHKKVKEHKSNNTVQYSAYLIIKSFI